MLESENIKRHIQESVTYKRIGIWGFGVVGKSVLRFVSQQRNAVYNPSPIVIFDKRTLTDQEKTEISRYGGILATDKTVFLSENEVIIPSPGINIASYYEQYVTKWLCELDLFAAFFTQLTTAITGSFGKTSITTLLSDCMTAQGTINAKGGNIGIACLGLVAEQKATSHALLEVSSFQLMHTRLFAPNLAIITNIVPNHLDWHASEDEYVRAKLALLVRQTASQKALLPWDLKDRINALVTLKSQRFFFTDSAVSPEQIMSLTQNETLFYRSDDMIMKYSQGIHTPLISYNTLPHITFDQNWLIVVSALHIMDIDVSTIPFNTYPFAIPEHRLEHCGTVNGVTIYNDSKGTIPDVTSAAVKHLQDKPILLIIGGLSKGIDRTSFIAALKYRVKKVYTFGAETAFLSSLCNQFAIPVTTCISLEDVVAASMRDASCGDQILFSPAGSSYDLFKDYQQRGARFKELIKKQL